MSSPKSTLGFVRASLERPSLQSQEMISSRTLKKYYKQMLRSWTSLKTTSYFISSKPMVSEANFLSGSILLLQQAHASHSRGRGIFRDHSWLRSPTRHSPWTTPVPFLHQWPPWKSDINGQALKLVVRCRFLCPTKLALQTGQKGGCIINGTKLSFQPLRTPFWTYKTSLKTITQKSKGKGT